jgi:hypothetical protein
MQIEFNFWEAKQYWAFEDFISIIPTRVTNTANLLLFRVDMAYRLQVDIRQRDADYNILGLRADWRAPNTWKRR